MSGSSDGEWIAATCDSLGLQPTGRQLDALVAYLRMLQRWNATYNLTAVRDAVAMRSQHLADCVAVIPSLRQHQVNGRILDVGSGGGLPGVVIAALMPELDVTCVDAVGKKAAFVRQAAGVLPLPNLRALHLRVEHLPPDDRYDLVTSRAFASLADMTRLTRRSLKSDGRWVAMKGRTPVDEIKALPDEIEVFHVEPLEVPTLNAERCLVWMRPASAFSN